MILSDQHGLHGILVIDKPHGFTSHDVVDRVRKITGVRRVGHAGTLDPFATGVLVVAIGKATRFLRYIADTQKRYQARVVLGVETDTCDLEGAITRIEQPDSWPSVHTINERLEQFTGTIEQTPPAFSAIRIDGKRAYDRARAGETVEIPARQVTIHALDIIHYAAPDLFLDITCTSGTYIRSLARDIGSALQTAGYCHALRRTQVGDFCLCQAWTLDQLSDIHVKNIWSQVAMHPAAAVSSFDVVILSDQESTRWLNGNKIRPGLASPSTTQPTRVYSCQGQFLGLGLFDDDAALSPKLVVNTST